MIVADANGVATLVVGVLVLVLTVFGLGAEFVRRRRDAERAQADRFTAWGEDGGIRDQDRAGGLLVVKVGYNNASDARIRDVRFYVTTSLGPVDYEVGGIDPGAKGVATVPIEGSERAAEQPDEKAGLAYTFADAQRVKWKRGPDNKLRKATDH
jgi:hypothetical protein